MRKKKQGNVKESSLVEKRKKKDQRPFWRSRKGGREAKRDVVKKGEPL